MSRTGLLIVSHSQKIAEGVRELAEQATQGLVPIAAAGGSADGGLGTSADLVLAGAQHLAEQGADGIVVLVDLGSAVMSAEIALEGFSRPYVLSDAPLVEGAVLGAVEASIGADLQRTATAAQRAVEMHKVQAEAARGAST